MKRLSLLLTILGLTFLSACNRESRTASEALPFNPYVEAFTSGKISRQSSVYVMLNQDVDSTKIAETNWKKAASITPQIAGQFAFENNHTLIFKPAEAFDRNKDYTVTLRMSEWFEEAEGSDKQFSFQFATLPLMLRGHVQSLDPVEGDDNLYNVSAVIFTSDTETSETVESLIKFPEQNEIEWTHSPDGKKHEISIRNLAAQNRSRSYAVSVAANKLGATQEDIFAFDIPGSNEFTVFDTRFTSEPQRYIEVTFSKNLDKNQDMEGLVYIVNNSDGNVTVDGNKLRVYPDAQRKGAVTVHLNESIRSEGGITLGESQDLTVEVASNVPSVKFIGNGTIIPQSTRLVVPFQAVYLRGVVARVIKIQERNVGQFLQVNQLDQGRDLMRVGRLIARKTIFFDDDENNDLTQTGTYAIDLREFIEPEPGAIYRLELTADRSLSAYPCDDNADQPTKEEILAQDEIRFREEAERYDETEHYYYYYDDYDYGDYYTSNYTPCSPYFWHGVQASRNVLATNLGLTAMAGETNEITVLVHNLLTTQPERGVEVTVRNYQHTDLGKGTTDDKGRITIAYESGKPFYLIASKDRQRSYLRVDGGSALSLSSFDVSGAVVQKGIKGFIYGDRGVWRPGDTLYLSFMLNDRAKTLPENHPVTLELVNPLGQVYLKKTTSHGIMGTYSFEMPTDPDAQTGAWTVRVLVGGVTFTKSVRIETIKPNRLKINIQNEDKILLRGEPMDAPIHVEWMTGATARNLDYDIQGMFQAITTTFANYKDYAFDDPAKTFKSEESSIIEGTTDENGNGTIKAKFDIGTSAPGMLMGNFVTRVFEESGDFSIDAFRMQYSPYKNYIGIKSPQKEKDRQWLVTGSPTQYEVVSVDYTGKPVANVETEVTVYRVRWYWWWSSDKNRLASFIADSHNEPVKTMTLKTDGNGKASFDLSFTHNEWGTYYVAAKDRFGNHSAGVMNYYDWPYLYGRRDADGNPAANILTFKTDKDTYAPGEKMAVTIPSTTGARAVVSIMNGSRVLSIHEFECKDKETLLHVDVTDDMQPNAYVYISLLQPHGNTENDLPIRLYGVVPVTVTAPESRLNPVISIADEIKPEERYDVTVSEKNGREMSYTLAIVDEGLLDLTRFKTPDPWSVFNAREALGVSTWDLYNYVVGAYGGRIEQYFSIGGDDEAGSGPKAIVNRFKPVVQFEGPFQLKPGEKRRHWYNMPNYNGRVRVMVVAGDGKAYGNAEKSVFVRKPVMILGTLPRVIGLFEEMDVPAAVFATKENVGNVQVTIQTSDNMEVIGEKQKTLNFSRIEDQMSTFRVRVKGDPGAGKVTLTATARGEKATYETDIEIRSVRRPQTKLTSFVLEPGKNWNQNLDLPGAEGTNKLSLEMSDVPPLNLTSRLQYLLGYPHGCLEQITSKAFPQLYLKDFASLTKEQEASVEIAVKEVVNRLRSYQMNDGAFSYWPGGSYYNGWSTTYAIHFILEAETKGYHVPANLKNNALTGIRRQAREWKANDNRNYYRSDSYTQAYRLYVLALGKTPEVGAMNRLKERKNLGLNVRWMLASAYALVGRTDVAKELTQFTEAMTEQDPQYDLTYGSSLRDKAVRLITLCLLDETNSAATLAREISESLSTDHWYSTQTTAFTLMAMSKYMGKYKSGGEMAFAYNVNGKSNPISTTKNIWSENLLEKTGTTASLSVSNTGGSTLFGRVVTEGVPNQGEEEAYQHGIVLTVQYQDASGRAVETSQMTQGENFKATVTVRNNTGNSHRNLAITQVFPSGWEILNTRFLNDGAMDENTPGISYQDIRDDRVYSYIDYLPPNRHVTFSIDLSAIYRGKFYLPPVYCEAMYDYLVRANTTGSYIEVK